MMTMIGSSKTRRATVVVGAVSGTIVVSALILRAIKRRYFSPTICCKLSCQCGKIQGRVCAKWEDSIRIWCYCDDCRQYADYVANLQVQQHGKKKNITQPKPIYGEEYGESRVVQVCKSDVTIDKGQDLLQLSRKFPPPSSSSKKTEGAKNTKGKKEQLYMHRYYSKCCYVPIFQTVDFLGFVGIFTDNLESSEEYERYDGPVAMFTELALKPPDSPPPDIFVPGFLWKLIRYLPYRNVGPFDYDQQPTYWGGSDKKE
mmetsp:Transcript_20251/g.48250  ORF Transcript_20251/g.48250 Transcript_20251/m.48250 type:complete len:258 (+) Transcript_20251:85-858(+)